MRRAFDQLYVQIRCEQVDVLMGFFYRPEHSCMDFLVNFDNLLNNLRAINDKIVCLGDFNDNSLDETSYHALQLGDVIASLGMTQIISGPTRGTEHSELPCLIITAFLGNTSYGLICASDISDHFLTYCSLSFRRVRYALIRRTYRDFRGVDFWLFGQCLVSVLWSYIYGLGDVESKLAFLNLLKHYLS